MRPAVWSRRVAQAPSGEHGGTAAPDPSFISLDQVYKIYRVGGTGVAALGGVTLRVARPGFAAIVGPSGAGKSTILNLIGGVEPATAGLVSVAGKDLSLLGSGELTDYRRLMVGFLWQGAARNLIPYLCAADNIAVPLVLAGKMTPTRRRERVAELLELLGLTGRARHLPRMLSGGEQQRLALAVALANAPPIVLADEPTADIDREAAERVIGALSAVSRELGACVVMSTHDLAAASQADQIYRLLDGRTRRPAGQATIDEAGLLKLPPAAAHVLGMAQAEIGVEIEGSQVRLSPAPTRSADSSHLDRPTAPDGLGPTGETNVPAPARSASLLGSAPLLVADGLHRVYRRHDGATIALRDVSLRLHSGELLAVMGPSGSGKSTLLGLLGGFDAPDDGQVWWEGHPLSDLPPAEVARLRAKRIGVIFQALGLFPALTARENVVLPLLLSGVKPVPADRTARTWLERLGLGDRTEHRVNELSLGQQQRVALARALAPEPVMVLADEPTTEVDHGVAALMLDALGEVTQRGGGVIVASHDPQVRRYARQVIALRDGELTERR